jgi:ACS family pantothenate transporter-like MFS transporter
MNLWLKSLGRYSVTQINTYPTVTNAVTILTSLVYGWTSDAIQLRSPIVFFSLTVCFFAAMNLAVWDGVPFGLKWASYYLTGCVFLISGLIVSGLMSVCPSRFAQGSGPVFLVSRLSLPPLYPTDRTNGRWIDDGQRSLRRR